MPAGLTGLPYLVTRRTVLAGSGALAIAAMSPTLGVDNTIRTWRRYADCRIGQIHVAIAEPVARPTPAKPALVCLHRSPVSGIEFAAFQAVMATDRQVLCPDTVGYGGSDSVASQPAIEDYAAALADALIALGYGEGGEGAIDVVGSHTGALIAVALATSYPGLVRALVLPGVPLFPEADRPSLLQRWGQPRPFIRDPGYVGRSYRDTVIDAADGLSPARRHALFTTQLRSGMDSHFGLVAAFRYDTENALARIRQPVLLPVLNETLGPNTRAAAAFIRNATLLDRPTLGSRAWDLQPERVASDCREFLDALPRQKASAGTLPDKGPTRDSSNVRRWRSYARTRYGQLHMRSGAPKHTDRAPIVLLHQSPLSGLIFEELIAELCTDRIVHAVDTPGFGDSDGPRRQPEIADYAAATAEGLRDLGAGPFDVFGFHTGSCIAAELARQSPDLVRRLILCGVPYYEASRRLEMQNRFLRPYAFWNDPDYVDEMYRRIVINGDPAVDAKRRLQRFTDRMLAGPNGEWGPRAVFAWDADAGLAAIRTPTLFMAFEEVMTEPTRKAHRRMPGAQFRYLPDLGMMGFMTKPAIVAAAIRDYLDGERR